MRDLGELFLRFLKRGKKQDAPNPLLVELLGEPDGEEVESYERGPFGYSIRKKNKTFCYGAVPRLDPQETVRLRKAVQRVSLDLEPEKVEPFTFENLVERLTQMAAGELAKDFPSGRTRELSGLVAFEAIGLSTFHALSLDDHVTEFYLDSRDSPLYLDHRTYGRCETEIVMSTRETKAIETHMDTFKGFTLDFAMPSLKNELEIAGNRLRVSLDLAPLAVHGFALDVRKLTSYSLTMADLLAGNVLSEEAAAFLLAALDRGFNLTVVGETGTGKTTLLNVLDEALDPRLRRVYIEDAVETKNLLGAGFHQMKLRVDPFERTTGKSRTKAAEIVKILHRSPDLVILGEVQSREHSQAFFHALAAGVRGMQTFHSSSPEQAIRRWVEIHRIPRANILDLDIIVQMRRPQRLGSLREVSRIALVVDEGGEPAIRDIFARDGRSLLVRTASWDGVKLRNSLPGDEFRHEVETARARLARRNTRGPH